MINNLRIEEVILYVKTLETEKTRMKIEESMNVEIKDRNMRTGVGMSHIVGVMNMTVAMGEIIEIIGMGSDAIGAQAIVHLRGRGELIAEEDTNDKCSVHQDEWCIYALNSKKFKTRA